MEADSSDPLEAVMETSEDDRMTKEFNQAAQRVQMMASNLSKDQLLYLYARYKQATVGKCNTLRPGMFDFQGKQKWDAWNGLGAMTRDCAMTEYVTMVKDVDPDWSVEPEGGSGRGSGMGVGVSTMCNTEDEISDVNKTIFDWCKEGNVDHMRRILSEGGLDINDTDDEGMGLLHWACDRGHIEVTQVLLDHCAGVNILDEEGQTPLHYAAACDHVEVVKVLLQHNANQKLRDNEGCTPRDVTTDGVIRELLSADTDR